MEGVQKACAVPLVVVAGLLVGCGGSSKTEDAAANQEIISELLTYPGAREYDQHTAAYFEDDCGLFGCGALGHTTNTDYQVPEGTDPASVSRFYAARLSPAWTCREERTEHLLHCKRGTAILGVNPDTLGASPPRYELVVDHDDRTR